MRAIHVSVLVVVSFIVVGCPLLTNRPTSLEIEVPDLVKEGGDLRPIVRVLDSRGRDIEDIDVHLLSSNPSIWQPEFDVVNQPGELTIRAEAGELHAEAQIRVRSAVEGTWRRESPPFTGMVVTIEPDESGALVGTIVERMDPDVLAAAYKGNNAICATNFWAPGTVKLRSFQRLSTTEYEAQSGGVRYVCQYGRVNFNGATSRVTVDGGRLRIDNKDQRTHGAEQDWVAVEHVPVDYLRRANDIGSLGRTLSDHFGYTVEVADWDDGGKLDFMVHVPATAEGRDTAARIAYEIGAVTGRSDWNSDKVVVGMPGDEPWLVFTTAKARSITIGHPYEARVELLEKLAL